MITGLCIIGGVLVTSLVVVIIVLRVIDHCQPLDPEDPE
jgi:hypothetical protein